MRKTFLLAAALCSMSLLAIADAAEPYPLEYWALRSVVNNAQVSPDGKYLLSVVNKHINLWQVLL